MGGVGSGGRPKFYTGELGGYDEVKRRRLITVMLRAGGYRHKDIVKATGYSLMTVKRVSRVFLDKPPLQCIVKPWKQLGISENRYFKERASIPEEEKERAKRERLITVMIQAGGYTYEDIAEATGYSLEEIKAVSAQEETAELLSPV